MGKFWDLWNNNVIFFGLKMISVSNFKVKNFCVATPYLVPKYLNKKVNIGDGFIFDSSIKLIKYNPHLVISSREELDDKKIDIINSSKMLIVTGANIIKDNFEIIRGFNHKILDKVYLLSFGSCCLC